jgi:hypothetical protein
VSLSVGSGKLSFALKTLRAHWDSTQSEWGDEVRRDFEENYLKPIEQEILLTTNAISNLDQTLIKALQECEEDF